MAEKKTTAKKGIMKDNECICPGEPEPPPEPCKKPDKMVCPPDPRFPNANQTRHCFTSFIDYQRCARLLGDYPGCKIFYICYSSLCPKDWIEKWFEQMEKGIFPKKIYPPKPIIRPDPAKMNAICLGEEDPLPNVC